MITQINFNRLFIAFLLLVILIVLNACNVNVNNQNELIEVNYNIQSEKAIKIEYTDQLGNSQIKVTDQDWNKTFYYSLDQRVTIKITKLTVNGFYSNDDTSKVYLTVNIGQNFKYNLNHITNILYSFITNGYYNE